MKRVPLNSNLREQFKDASLPFFQSSDGRDIRKALIVGGLFERNSQFSSDQLSPEDCLHVVESLRSCLDQDIAVPGIPEIYLQNLAYGEDNFLTNPPKGMHLVVFSNIFYCPISYDFSRTFVCSDVELQSGLSFVDGEWHSALLKTGARYAVNVTANYKELPTEMITRPPFAKVATRTSYTNSYDLLAR